MREVRLRYRVDVTLWLDDGRVYNNTSVYYNKYAAEYAVLLWDLCSNAVSTITEEEYV